MRQLAAASTRACPRADKPVTKDACSLVALDIGLMRRGNSLSSESLPIRVEGGMVTMDRLMRPAVSVALIVSLMVGSMVLLLIQPAYALTTVTVAVGGTHTVTPGAGETFSDAKAGDPKIVGVSTAGGNLTITCTGNGVTLVTYTVKKGAMLETRVILVKQGTGVVIDDGVTTVPLNTPQAAPGTFMEGAVSGLGSFEERTSKKGKKKADVTVAEGGAFVYILYTDGKGALHIICYTAVKPEKTSDDDDRRDQQEGGEY